MKTTSGIKVKVGVKAGGIMPINHNRTPEQWREMSSKGGKAAQSSGRGRRWTAEEARAAGAKGVQARLRYARERAEEIGCGS